MATTTTGDGVRPHRTGDGRERPAPLIAGHATHAAILELP